MFADEAVAVRHAFDGDTVALADGRVVRLLGINAPEMGRDGAADQPLAAAARAVVARHCEGRRVTLAFDTELLDRHGRTLAYVTLADGNDLQEMLLRAGLAWHVAVAPNVAKVARYRMAENDARANRRGIWEHASYRAKPAQQLRPGDGGFQRVEGTVQRIHGNAHDLYLELAPTFAVVIARSDWHYFSGQPAQFQDRRMIVRGWVSENRGSLRMRISHPSMLELP